MKFVTSGFVFLWLVLATLALKDPVCGEPFGVAGFCRAIIHKWSYNAANNQCEPFNYSGCSGNNNSFDDQQSCEQKCKE